MTSTSVPTTTPRVNTRRICIITPTAHYNFSIDGTCITAGDLRTCAVSAQAATLAVGTIAGELDAAAVKAWRWFASMLFKMLNPAPIDVTFCVRCEEAIADGDLCPACVAELRHEEANDIRRRQHSMVEMTGVQHPYRAHDALMHVWAGGK